MVVISQPISRGAAKDSAAAPRLMRVQNSSTAFSRGYVLPPLRGWNRIIQNSMTSGSLKFLLGAIAIRIVGKDDRGSVNPGVLRLYLSAFEPSARALAPNEFQL